MGRNMYTLNDKHFTHPKTGAPAGTPTGQWNWLGSMAQGALVGPFGAAALGYASQQQTNKAQVNQSREQREWSEYMWERQNAYNTPAMQMRRLREAGLNPALMYGKGNTGNAEKAMPYQQAKLGVPGVAAAQAAAAGAQLSLLNAQRRNIDADTNKKNKESGLTYQQTISQIIDNEIKDKTKQVFMDKHVQELELIKQQTTRERAVAKWEQWKAKLSDNNINANDNFLLRLASEWYHSMGEGEAAKHFFNNPDQYSNFSKWLAKETGKGLIDSFINRAN